MRRRPSGPPDPADPVGPAARRNARSRRRRKTDRRTRLQTRGGCTRGMERAVSGSWLDVLHYDLEPSVVERLARCSIDLHQSLAFSEATHLQRPVVAERIVAGLAEQRKPGPGASGATNIRVVAGPAIAPKIVNRAIPHVTERGRSFPNVLQRGVADVAASPGHRLQRRAALDGAVGLDAQRRAPRAARGRMANAERPTQGRV